MASNLPQVVCALSLTAINFAGWRWPIYELLWVSGFGFIVLFTFLPETLESTILLRRAERLRKLTGNSLLKSQSEIDKPAGETMFKLALENFVHAFQLSMVPAILFANVYIALVYSIFYLVRSSPSSTLPQNPLTPSHVNSGSK